MNDKLASFIDHTLLKPEATRAEIDKLLEEAIEHEFAAVCVNPYWVTYCRDQVKETNVQVCTVIGFPLGATTTETKVFEAKQAVANGASEVDMVINIGELKANQDDFVQEDIRAVVEAVKGKALTKVIIETVLLTDSEKKRACQLAKAAEADFVKTSTGFSGGGASVADIKLMRETVGPDIGVKASGGVRDFETARDMIDAGTTRIGASAGIRIVQEAR